jgi:hypothetical protein
MTAEVEKAREINLRTVAAWTGTIKRAKTGL